MHHMDQHENDAFVMRKILYTISTISARKHTIFISSFVMAQLVSDTVRGQQIQSINSKQARYILNNILLHRKPDRGHFKFIKFKC